MDSFGTVVVMKNAEELTQTHYWQRIDVKNGYSQGLSVTFTTRNYQPFTEVTKLITECPDKEAE
jgi:hypothetical protein